MAAATSGGGPARRGGSGGELRRRGAAASGVGGGAGRRRWAAARVRQRLAGGLRGLGGAAYKAPPGGVPLGYGPESVRLFFKKNLTLRK